MVERASILEILPRYDAVLLDSFGVMVDSSGALPGAGALLRHLEEARVPWMIVTNDASRLPSRIAAWYGTLGLAVEEGRILTSGSLLGAWTEEGGLAGASCVVLGTPDSVAYAAQAGLEVEPLGWESEAEVLAVCDDHGFELLEGLDQAISMLYRRLDRGAPMRLVLPNPDVLYPRGGGRYGFTSGAIALLLEAALERRYPGLPVEARTFARLGKPHAPAYTLAMRRLGSSRPLMIGDQIETDIRGARALGLDAALVRGGLGDLDLEAIPAAFRPTWLLETIAP